MVAFPVAAADHAGMTPDQAIALLDYHYWARDRALDAVAVLRPAQFTQDLGNSFGSIRDTLGHVYGADHVWWERWSGRTPTGLPPVAQFADVASLRAAWSALEQQVRPFVLGLGAEGLARPLTYRGFNGQLATVTFAQMLQHVVNHGSYHRGQVTTLLRQLGMPPGKSMDLIAFYRERGG